MKQKICQEEVIRQRISEKFLDGILQTIQKWPNEQEIGFMVAAFLANVSSSDFIKKERNWGEIVPILAQLLLRTHTDIKIHVKKQTKIFFILVLQFFCYAKETDFFKPCQTKIKKI